MSAVARAAEPDPRRDAATIRTSIPYRLDRLPWSRFHWRVVVGLGAVWILDGLEVTNVGSVASRLTQHGSGIAITVAQVGWAASIYIIGACLGALFFGYLTDRFGRKRLFLVTLGVYLVATALTAVSTEFWLFWLFRFFTGFGIGGEYAAINSAIDELIPARARGSVDLIINGSYWLGSAGAAGLSLIFLSPLLPTDVGWRLAFAIGVVLGLLILVVRRNVPESPRWLFIHGRIEEAERLVDGIESEVEAATGQPLRPPHRTLEVRPRGTVPFTWIARVAFREYPTRSILALALFVGQAFIYNGITFNLGTLMSGFFHVSSGAVPVFIVLYAAGNLLGPLTIGRLFDTVGRKPMITATYAGSALVGVALAAIFWAGGILNAWSFIALVMVTFFLASAGASAAYLTASEIFPMETRALAIAFFYAIGTAVGGVTGPALFGNLIASGSRTEVAIGFLIGSAVMALGATAEVIFGVKAERRSLEQIAQPLTAVGGEAGGNAEHGPEQRGAESRRRAAEERARAASLRATAHDHLARAAAGDDEAAARANEAESLAEVADRIALAYDELTAHHEALQSADEASSGGAAEAATHRARAAEERALAHTHEAHALEADEHALADRHRELAAAAHERARAEEQLALAEEEREQRREQAAEHEDEEEAGEEVSSSGSTRIAMHERFAGMHAARARSHVARAEANAKLARAAAQEADVLAEEARALAFRQEAEERRSEAREAATPAGSDEGEDVAAAEQRIRARLERRRSANSSGLRRYRPGPGRLSALPPIGTPTPLPEESLDHEILAIAHALAEHGPLDRRELARLVGARYWGPGVFSEALRQALAEQSVRRVGHGVYAPAEHESRHRQGA